MTAEFLRDLAWLPAPPGDFRARLKALAANGDWAREARALAGFALDEPKLTRLGAAISSRLTEAVPAGLERFTLGLAGFGTLALLTSALVASFARYGFALEVVVSDYDQPLPEAVDPNSRINSARPDAVLLALDWRGLPLRPRTGDAESAQAQVDASLGLIDALRDGFAKHAGCACLISTVAPPWEPIAGGIDRALPGTPRQICDAINRGLADRAAQSADVLFDAAALAETVGLANWHNPTLWHTAKAPFDLAFIPLWADHVARLAAALRGKSRRVLVLDLDNTLWGGVIGDDGLEGIVVGQGDATGEAFLAVQRLALAYRERGVVLAVSSKNTDAVARRAFLEHPDMLLRLDHIAVFQANWDDKAANIKAIAQELALGLESFVLLDDNPVERALVRAALPEVAAPELPHDPALYPAYLTAAGYFDLTTFSAEDASRADQYQLNARRAALQGATTDMDSFLRSLDMQITFAPFDAVGQARIAQLINKSNQFNLTTRRYAEAEVAVLRQDRDLLTLQVRLSDAFGDNGMISVVICRPIDEQVWEIDTWLMSCRVLNRGVEKAVLAEILHHARQRGVTRILGRYLPTAKNGLVADHYANLGFAPVDGASGPGTLWTLSADADVNAAAFRVVRTGFDQRES